MSRYDDFIRRVESEADAEGPEAVAQLQAFRDYYRLGRQLAERRRELHWTQTFLADLTGIRQSEISRIERAVGNPTLMTVSRLTAALQMDFQCSMREESEPVVDADDLSDFASLTEWVGARGLLTSFEPAKRRAVLLCVLQRERHMAGPSLRDLEQGATSPAEPWVMSLDPLRRLSVVLDAAFECSDASKDAVCTELLHDSTSPEEQTRLGGQRHRL